MSQTITIDPVTRLEGHGKVTLKADDDGSSTSISRSPRFADLRGSARAAVLRNAEPDGAHLRHMPGKPPDRIRQGVRSDHVGWIPHTAAQLRRMLNLRRWCSPMR